MGTAPLRPPAGESVEGPIGPPGAACEAWRPFYGLAYHLACWMFVGVLAGFGGCGLYDVGHKLLGG
ncbi:MAG TPA: hypothetical protein VM031_04020 [Phycisphaerae bacterium]|nr:hypothetical protein [Phycisphaerae bacterium]